MSVKAKQIESGTLEKVISFTQGRESVETSGPHIIGFSSFNPSEVGSDNRIITWEVVLQSSDGYIEANVELFNLTDGYTVSGTEIASTSQTPESASAILTVPDDLPNSLKDYEVRLSVDAESENEFVSCYKAQLKITWS